MTVLGILVSWHNMTTSSGLDALISALTIIALVGWAAATYR